MLEPKEGVAQSWRHHKEVPVTVQRLVGEGKRLCLLVTSLCCIINVLSLEVNKSRPCEESFTSCQDTSVVNLQEANSYSG